MLHFFDLESVGWVNHCIVECLHFRVTALPVQNVHNCSAMFWVSADLRLHTCRSSL